MISIPETNYDKLSISFEKIKVGSTLKDLVLLSDNQTTIIYNLNLLNDGKIIITYTSYVIGPQSEIKIFKKPGHTSQ